MLSSESLFSNKFLVSVVGLFLGPAAAHLQMHLKDASWGGEFWLGAVLAGIFPVAAYLVGYYQINPANQPRSATALLAAVNATTLPPEAKAATVEALGGGGTPRA